MIRHIYPFLAAPAFLSVLSPAAAQAKGLAAPLGYFLDSFGPAARPNLILGWVFGGICMGVCLLIALLLLFAIFHRRKTQPAQTVIRKEGGLKWVYIGTGISTSVLFAMAVYALVVLSQTAEPPTQPRLTITVTGYQWWWKVDYDDPDPAKRFTTANEIHIPTGEPVRIELKSADVIHAFWVPLLAGKTQMIPGQTNRQWLQADKPGRYWGQCTQFCGVQHAHMAYEVVAESPADFAAWEEAQRKPASPANDEIGKGGTIFLQQCAACHAVRGTDAAGGHAPDLTHLQSRRLLAAGLMTNTPDHLSDWIVHAQELKPGVRMPDFDFSAQDKADLMAYLETLQ